MLKIIIKKSNDIIDKFVFIGHASYDIKGKDIVCASVSSAMLTTVNAILNFDKSSINYNEDNDVTIVNLKKDNITNRLLDNLDIILKELESQYPDNIKITEEGGN